MRKKFENYFGKISNKCMSGISLMVLLLLITPLKPICIVISIGAFALGCIYINKSISEYHPEFRWFEILLSLFLVAVIPNFFIQNWGPLVYENGIRSIMGIPYNLFLRAVAFLAGLFSFVFLYPLLCALCGTSDSFMKSCKSSEIIIQRKSKIVLLAIAIIIISVMSKSSPLYPFNDWVDANCYMTVGKSMWHGLVPYKDLYEQKGLLIYVLHAFCTMISYKTFLPVYFVEIFCCFVFLYNSYRIFLLYICEPEGNRKHYFMMFIFAAAVYASSYFGFGDSAEEWSIPLISYTFFLGLRWYKTGREISRKEYLMIGLTSGIIFWIKFNLTGFYIGWIIVPAILMIKTGRVKEFITDLLMVLTGVVIVTSPVISYFLIAGGLKEMFTAYFYNNLFLYNRNSVPVYQNILSGLRMNMETIIYFVLFICGAILVRTIFRRNKAEAVSIILCYAASNFFIYCNSHHIFYYPFVLSVYVILPISLLYIVLFGNEKIFNKQVMIKCLCLMTGAVYMIGSSQNMNLIFKPKSYLPQYQFAEIINQSDDPTLLNYNFVDGGFYTTAGIVPTTYQFCQLNITENVQEFADEINSYIDDAVTEFVVTRDLELNSDNYELVSSSSYFNEKKMRTYYLYQRVDRK